MNPYVQSPCTRCGATVWIPTATGVGYCPQCHNPTQLPAGAQPGAAPQAQPQGAPQPAIASTVAIPSMATPPGAGGANPWGGAPGAPPGAQPFQAFQPQQPAGGAAPQAPGAQPFQAFQPPQQSAPAPGAPPTGQGFQPFQPQQPFGGSQQGAAPGGFGMPQAPGGFGAPPGQFPGAPGGYPMPAMPAAASRGGMLKILLPVVGFVAISCIGAIAASKLKSFARPGHRSLSAYNIDERNADPDAMIRAAGELARDWRSDAVFSSINILGLRTNGTVDLSSSANTVTVEYFSPSRVSSFVERDRNDSIKKFVFTSNGISYETRWGVRRRVERPVATPTPVCGARQLGSVLAAQGVPPTATMHVQYDPQFAFAVNGALAWHVTSTAPYVDRWYDVGSCTFLRGR